MVSRCGIWPELSEKLSWASVASKMSDLEAETYGASLLCFLAKLRSPRPRIEAVWVILEAHRWSHVVGFGQSFQKS